jgi:hypothetical protein
MDPNEQLTPFTPSPPPDFTNPLKRWCYDNRVSARRLATNAHISLSQLPYLMGDDASKLDNVQLRTLYKVRTFTGVDLAAWYLDKKLRQ